MSATMSAAQGGVNALWRLGSALARPFQARATVQAGVPPRDPVLAQWFGGGDTASGVAVTADTAQSQSTVYTCVRIVRETVAQLPLLVWRRQADGGKEKARAHPLWSVLHLQANRRQTSFEWREMAASHLELRGEHTSEIVTGNDGQVRELVPLHPDRTRAFEAPDGTVAVEHWPVKGGKRILLASEILRITADSDDGIRGRSPIELHRETIGLALATRQYGAEFFGNSAQPKGAIKIAADLDDEAVEALIKGWEARHRGEGRRNRLGVLYGGMEWEQIGLTNEDAQFIETAKLTRSDLFGIYRIPPHMGGDLERSTNNNIEHQGLEFQMYSMLPRLRRFEDRLNASLLSAAERREYEIGFNVAGLVRGDFKSQQEGFAVGRNGGWLSVNDIRELLDLNRIEGGDVYLQPLNMVDASQALAVQTKDKAPSAAPPAEGNAA